MVSKLLRGPDTLLEYAYPAPRSAIELKNTCTYTRGLGNTAISRCAVATVDLEAPQALWRSGIACNIAVWSNATEAQWRCARGQWPLGNPGQWGGAACESMYECTVASYWRASK